MKKKSWTIAVLLTSSVLGGCPWNTEPDATDSFKELRACSANQMIKTGDIIYTGPLVQPIGTVYAKAPSGGYDPLWRGTRITGDNPSPNMVERNPPGACTYKGNSSIDLKTAFSISTNPIPITAEVSNDFKNARVVDMSAQAFSWDTLYKGEYQAAIDKLDRAGPLYNDLVTRNAYASVALLKVRGYSVKLQVNAGDVAALKTKYNGPFLKQLSGDIGANVGVSFTADNEMVLTIGQEAYVAAIMRPFSQGRVQAAGTSADLFGASDSHPRGKAISVGVLRD